MVLAGIIAQQSAARPGPAAGDPSCRPARLIAELNRPDGLGRAPLAVLWSPNHGPQILYDTPHRVITTLYARNDRGQLDAYAIYTATDWEIARELAAERGIDLIVTCIDTAIYGERSDRSGTLETALRRGEFPPWLEPVALGAETRGFRLYRRVSPAP
jgi:hypothetical protein